MHRRHFVGTLSAASIGVMTASGSLGPAMQDSEKKKMFGLIGKMTAVEGKREELIAILLEGTSGGAAMPGCLSYVIARDTADGNGIWITEVWDSAESHKASLTLPRVKAAIAKGRPLISGFSNGVTTEPVGGHGLAGKT